MIEKCLFKFDKFAYENQVITDKIIILLSLLFSSIVVLEPLSCLDKKSIIDHYSPLPYFLLPLILLCGL